ncbi:putative beta-barrel porin [Balneicella halophila]|uniref:Putative beta-barrel porin n=2 Tax=Balneicella halophila TaxID=1537566 RepID=A0A7L4URI8_BALHA|nr:putative beta-barrel porin [Balneicella halophila]
MTKLLSTHHTKFILIGIFLLTGSFTWGQSREGDGGTSGGHISREEYRKLQDSLKANKIEPLVKLWQLEADGAYKVRHYRDTTDMDRQILYPNFKKSIANTFTGNAGAANQSALFIHREPVQEFLFLQPYEVYISRPETHKFIDTRTPYSELNYSTGGNNNREENILNVLVTQNINKDWNVGLEYNLISSDGQYQNQKHKVYDFTVFSSYEKGHYKLYGYLNHNRIKLQENGGIADDNVLKADTTIEAPNMEVRLFDTGASIHNFNYFLSHQYNIGEMRERVLFGDTTQVYPIKIVHTLHLDKSSRKYYDQENTDDYYQNFIYAFNTPIEEKTTFQNLKNSAQVVLNEGYFNWFKYGLRAEVSYEKIKYELPALKPVFPNNWDLGMKEIKQDNLSLEVGAFYSSTEKTNWAAHWRTYFSGYRSGDTEAKAHYTHYLGNDSLRNHKLQVDFKMTNQTPSLLWNQYFSNHIYWKKDLNKETQIKLGGYYHNKAWKLEAGGYWQALKNYTFFGENALPQQSSDEIVVFTAYAKKNFHWWKMHFEPTVYWQQSSNEDLLPLPMISAYANTYFESDLFQKAIRLRVGIDARFYTKWYAPDYMPATGQFFLQKEKELGGYPKLDAYFVAQFKRATFFMKYEHINNLISDNEYFSALHYPITPHILKYGVRWYFYD